MCTENKTPVTSCVPVIVMALGLLVLPYNPIRMVMNEKLLNRRKTIGMIKIMINAGGGEGDDYFITNISTQYSSDL